MFHEPDPRGISQQQAVLAADGDVYVELADLGTPSGKMVIALSRGMSMRTWIILLSAMDSITN